MSAEVPTCPYICELEMKVKVIQTGIKLYSLVVSIVMPSLKEISQ